MKKFIIILLLSSCAPGIHKEISLAEREALVKHRKEDKQVAMWFIIISGFSLYVAISE